MTPTADVADENSVGLFLRGRPRGGGGGGGLTRCCCRHLRLGGCVDKVERTVLPYLRSREGPPALQTLLQA